MKAEQIKQFTQKLYEEKDLLTEQIVNLEKSGIHNTLAESVGELSVCDNHPADLGDELFERSKDIALRDNARILLDSVNYALKKIANGTYGCCDKCGQGISLARLEAVSWASECINCQKDDEIVDSTPRPLEEEVLKPQFKSGLLDSDYIDDEDALQAVLRYGSSDTPQDMPGTHNYKHLFPNSNEHEGIVDSTDAIPANPNNYNRNEK